MNSTSPYNSAPVNEVPEDTPRAPENENTLAALAMPLGETVLVLTGQGAPAYGILHRSRAMTGQSDFFRLQFRGYAQAEGHEWQPFTGDDAHFHATQNCAWVRVDHPSRSVTFGPRGGITASEAFHGTGLATYLFGLAISWVKGIYPDYTVNPGLITLSSTVTEEERLQRNAFYASQGFQFEWQDANQRSALFFQDKINKLLGVWDREHISEISGEAMLQSLAEQDTARAQLEEQLARQESAQSALRQALQKEKNTSQIMMGVIILAGIMAIWAVV